jgi:TRAP-type C4-dicarboxylate transport system substrate-binding protein
MTLDRFAAAFALLAVAAAAAAARAADAPEIKFAFPAPPASFVNTKGVTPWIADVERAAGDALKIRLFTGPTLGDFRVIYDRTLDGVTDISFGVFGSLGGQFRQTSVSALPFESSNTSEAGLALWRLFETGVIAGEFDKVRVLALFNFPSSHVHTKSAIRSVDDLKGLKFGVSGREVAQLVVGLGGTPISMPPPDLYMSVNRGVVDGVVIAWTAVQTFKLLEVTKFHIEAHLGMAPAFIFMNKASHARLPARAREAIDRHAGEPFTRRLGREIDQVDAGMSREAAATAGHVVAGIPEDQMPHWRSRIQALVDAWVAETPDGARVLAAYRAEIRKIRRGN